MSWKEHLAKGSKYSVEELFGDRSNSSADQSRHPGKNYLQHTSSVEEMTMPQSKKANHTLSSTIHDRESRSASFYQYRDIAGGFNHDSMYPGRPRDNFSSGLHNREIERTSAYQYVETATDSRYYGSHSSNVTPTCPLGSDYRKTPGLRTNSSHKFQYTPSAPRPHVCNDRCRPDPSGRPRLGVCENGV